MKHYTVTLNSSVQNYKPENTKNLYTNNNKSNKTLTKKNPGLVRATQALKLVNPFRGI